MIPNPFDPWDTKYGIVSPRLRVICQHGRRLLGCPFPSCIKETTNRYWKPQRAPQTPGQILNKAHDSLTVGKAINASNRKARP